MGKDMGAEGPAGVLSPSETVGPGQRPLPPWCVYSAERRASHRRAGPQNPPATVNRFPECEETDVRLRKGYGTRICSRAPRDVLTGSGVPMRPRPLPQGDPARHARHVLPVGAPDHGEPLFGDELSGWPGAPCTVTDSMALRAPVSF